MAILKFFSGEQLYEIFDILAWISLGMVLMNLYKDRFD
jgi:hypothetical protein